MVKRVFICLGLILTVLPARSAIIHVRAGASGTETNGLSWATAFTSITQALQHAASGDEIWVAGGTYKGAVNVPDGVALYGGFAGYESVRTDRYWARNRSIIHWHWFFPLDFVFENPFQKAVTLGSGSRLDGFTVIKGRFSYGAGVYAGEPGATIANNTIVTNASTGSFGSALFVDGGGEFDTGDDFFLKTATDLLRLHFPFGATNIPVAAYGPTVHRLLQVTANVYDAAHSDTFPSVFRPQFTATPQGVIISGYYRDDSASTVDAWLSTNPHNIPMIIGARKGFPNFNELAIQTAVLVARRLELRRYDTNSPPYQTNEMYIIGISNLVGVEAWNSYTQAFGNDVQIQVSNVCAYTLSTGEALTYSDRKSNAVSIDVAGGTWPGFVGDPPRPFLSHPSFKVPLLANEIVLPASIFRFLPPHVEPLSGGVVFDASSGFRIPDWSLAISNHLVFMLTSQGRIIDFVMLNNLTNVLNLTAEFFRPIPYLDEGFIAQCWSTNRAGPGIYAPTEGIQAQLDVSLGNAAVSPAQWQEADFDPSPDKDAEIDRFRQFVDPALNRGNSNLLQIAPFSPGRKIIFTATWQANDPLVHGLAEHLKDSTNDVASRFVYPWAGDVFWIHNLAQVNNRYRPWGARPREVAAPQDRDARLKDPGVRKTDDFDFPSGSRVNVRWLDRIHRGTPWQTLYFDRDMAALSDWIRQFPDPMAHPTNDWKVIKHLRAWLGPLASVSPTRVLNNTIVGNYGSGIWIESGSGVWIDSRTATVMNNVVAFNTSGLIAEGGEFNRNCAFGNGTGNEGDVSGSPQFVNAAIGDYSVLATSPLIDAGDARALAWTERPVLGAAVDIGALEFGPDGVPVFTFHRTSPTEYALALRGFSGQSYVVEASTNLVNWTAITTNIAVMGSILLQDADGTNYSHRFYRAKVANHPN